MSSIQLNIESIENIHDSKPNINESNLFINFPDIETYKSDNLSWINDIHINTKYLDDLTKQYDSLDISKLTNEDMKNILLKIIEFIDLTTLNADDTETTVQTLALKAIKPLKNEIKNVNIHTAAICVYPARVKDVIKVLDSEKARHVKVAAVAGGFPSGQYLLESRLLEIKLLSLQKVDEIDIVIQRCLPLTNQWNELYDEIKLMKEACGENIHLKTILGVGELKSNENIYCSSIIAMIAGSDFIKTSTGKEKINATIPAGIIMCLAIKHFHTKTGKKIGLKPAGGISTVLDAIKWISLVYNILGIEWLNTNLFRIGASSLLNNVLLELEKIK